MSRWDVSLNWGSDDGEREEDEAAAVVIAAAVRELSEQRAIWAPLIRAALAAFIHEHPRPLPLAERR